MENDCCEFPISSLFWNWLLQHSGICIYWCRTS